MVAVQAHPVNGAVLAAQGAAGGEEALQPVGQPQSPVGEQSVVADGDPQAGRDPIEDGQGAGGFPAPEAWQEGDEAQAMQGDMPDVFKDFSF